MIGHIRPSLDTFSADMHIVEFVLASHVGINPGPHDVSRQLSESFCVFVFFANHDNSVSDCPDIGVLILLCEPVTCNDAVGCVSQLPHMLSAMRHIWHSDESFFGLLGWPFSSTEFGLPHTSKQMS